MAKVSFVVSSFLLSVSVSLVMLVGLSVAVSSVAITSNPWVTIGTDATITCSIGSLGAFTDLQFQRSNESITDGDFATVILQYNFASKGVIYNPAIDSNHYDVQEARSGGSYMYTIIIKTVTLDDGWKYWCRFQENPPVNKESASSVTQIRVPLSMSTFHYDGKPYSDGDSFPVVAGDGNQFTCSTPAINPAATFTWTLTSGSTIDNSSGTQTDSANNGDSRLVDSTNTITISIPEIPSTSTLTCGATNRQDGMTGTEIDITVTLHVRVPPKDVKLSDSSGDKVPGATVSVNQSRSHTFTCKVQGTRPAATIAWLVAGTPPSTGDSTSMLVNDLWETSGTWSFIPARSDHKQEVKCIANTMESEQPFPSANITMDVNGPPDTPAITGSLTMTEGQPTRLTCTAVTGYPDTWMLVWSIGVISIPDPTTVASPSGDRFTFSSTFDYTPMREVNRATINCGAEWDSWTSTSKDTFGPINVQYAPLFTALTKNPDTPIIEGGEVTFMCTVDANPLPDDITWEKQGSSDVDVLSPVYGTNTSTLTLTDVKKEQAGNYTCRTNNGIPTTDPVNDVVSSPVTLIVHYPPIFSPPMQTPNTPIVEGNGVVLTCSADANPMPSDFITWEKQGSGDVPGFAFYSDGRSTLTISNITREQAGYYRCRANNGVPDASNDVHSDNVTLIVHYEPNITNKAANEVGAQHGEDAELLCIAVGNPRPNITWLSPNNTEIFNDMSKYTVQSMITGGDSVFENIVTGNLTIRNVSSQVDYGQYTCISTNGIGSADFLIINVTGPRQPDKPSGVRITDRTANSLTVRWTAGYDGGKDQWFHVAHLKEGDWSEIMSDEITANDYKVTGLEAYTDYEIRVYAQNEIGRNPNYAQTSTKTLPNPPNKDSGFVIEFNKAEGTVKVEGLGGKDGCIKIEVLYTDSSEWSKCGKCIKADQTVVLDQHCPKPQQTRRKRAVGDVTDVRASNCQGDLCSEPVVAEKVSTPPPKSEQSDITGIIVGGVIGCLALVAVIGGLAFYLRKTSPSKQKDVSCSSIELQGPDLNSDTGVSNEGLQGSGTGNTAIYAQVNKKGNQPKSFKAGGNANVTDSYLEMNNKPPARPEKPRNLPDVTYAVVDKEKKQPPPPPTQEGSKPPANKKKPKKYVPPSSRAEEESAYEDVMIDGKKAINPPPKEADDTYANFGEQQDNSGRVISEDGLIYAEVGHTKVHPPNQPPIRTEESTEYASLDFSRMKTNDST